MPIGILPIGIVRLWQADFNSRAAQYRAGGLYPLLLLTIKTKQMVFLVLGVIILLLSFSIGATPNLGSASRVGKLVGLGLILLGVSALMRGHRIIP